LLDVPRIRGVGEWIQFCRQSFSGCSFVKERCAEGNKTVDNYQNEWNERTGTFRNHPVHNWASNGADAFRQFAQGYRHIKKRKGASPQPKIAVI